MTGGIVNPLTQCINNKYAGLLQCVLPVCSAAMAIAS